MALIAVLVAFSLMWHAPNGVPAQQSPTYRMIAPDLAAQNEGEITAMVVEDTDKGEVPLNEGDEVVFQGEVVPVGPGGKIKLAGFLKEAGNQFLVLQVTRIAAGRPAQSAVVSQHIEVLPVGQAGQVVPTAVAHASEICTPGQPLRVTGQGLDRLQKAMLVGHDGTEHALGEPVGSSLQRVYVGPKDLPKGNYHFVAQDATGQPYQAPNQTTSPSLQVTGTQIRRRGQRGHFVVSCDIEADVLLSGGAPQIKLDTNLVHVTPQTPGQVGFTAIELGNYTLKSRILNREEIPPDPQAPRVDAKPEPVQARYDSSRNQTNVSCPVNVVDQNGRPVGNTPVDVAVSHPNGVLYERVNTDNRGRASFLHTFAGQLSASALAVHAYRVVGRAWNKQPPPPPPPKKPQPPSGPPSAERPLPPPPPPGAAPAGPKPGPTPSPSPSACGPASTTYTVKDLSPIIPSGSPVPTCVATGVNHDGNVVGACSGFYFGAPGAWIAFHLAPGAIIEKKDDLGFPGKAKGGASFAMGVSDKDHVVGWWTSLGSGLKKAFLYDGSKMIDLHPPTYPLSTEAFALNSMDDVVGVADKGESALGPTFGGHAVLWPHDALGHAMTDLNDYMDSASKKDWKLVAAFGINEAGEIVGRALDLPHHKFHAFLLKGKGAKPIDLGALKEEKSDDSSAAYSINACDIVDKVVGYTYTAVGYRGFEWTMDPMGEMGTLSPAWADFPYTPDSYAQAINKKEEVVGIASVDWHASAIFEPIGPSCCGLDAKGIAHSHAVWYNGKELKDLNKLIPASPGWELELANGINDIGQIAGSGYYKKEDSYKSGFSSLKGGVLKAGFLTPSSKAVLLSPPGLTPAATSLTAAGPATATGYIFDNWNTSGVTNGPTKDTVFTIDVSYTITFVADYHWNGGKGAKPGMKEISLVDSHGTVYGPWHVTTSPGQGGAPDVNWECHPPGVVLPAETYKVVDPDPTTWSQNAVSGGSGFTRVAGYATKK